MQRQCDALNAFAVFLLHFVDRTAETALAIQHVLDVATGGKRLAGAGEDQDGNRIVGIDPFGGPNDVIHQLRAGQFVAHIVAIERQCCYASVYGDLRIFELRL